jgi:hypothetical protein
MRAPGSRAKKTGTTLKRGRATQIVCYPRLRTKAVLVEASREVDRPLSSFMIMASLGAAAALQGCEIAELIPPDELQQYGKIAQFRTPLRTRSRVRVQGGAMKIDKKQSA